MLRTIHRTSHEIRSGTLSPEDLLRECVQRVTAHEDQVQAWVFVDQNAQEQAKRCHEEIERGQWRGPLHGIPLGIKDIFDVRDWPTAAGSNLWKQSIARTDSTVVRRLRQAGAVLLGKTVTTQYASFDPPVTGNPWNLERTPGGSSSGSAAAIASGMCLGALGSQTGGSITRPASFCGVCGIKPTLGRVSVHGVVPLSPSMDHVGPMANCVTDLALLLQTIAGADPLDPSCSAQPVGNWSLADGRGLSPRIGRLRGLFEDLADPDMKEHLDKVCEGLASRGATIVEVALPASMAEVIGRHRTVMAVEAAAFHESRFRLHPEDYSENITALLEEGIGCAASEYARCKEHQRQLTREMTSCFGGLDVLIAPATRGVAPLRNTTGDPAMNSPWSYTGLPALSFPVGVGADNLPMAVQLVGRHWGEMELINVGLWCERVLELSPRDPFEAG